MPLPPKAKKQTMEEVLSKSPAALKKYIAEMDEMKKQREEEERMRFKRLAEEFNAWRGSEQSRREQSSREQSSREQSSKNQEELMTASMTLGIPINSSIREIKKAYHSLAMQTHPDKHPNDPNANAKFQAIESAYQKLSSMPKKGGNKCRNRRTHHVPKKKTQTHRHTTHHRKTHRVHN
jgi:DnaJ-domain-containing protein 1